MPDGPLEQSLIGTYRRFGPLGPVYKVLGVRHRLPDGEVMLRVLLVETGEEVQYRLSRAAEDPIAA